MNGGNPESCEVIVAGAGPAGMIAALAIARTGSDVVLAGPPAPGDDARTTALMVPAIEWLTDIGVGDVLSAEGSPLRAMRIVDATRRLVRSPTVTFHAAEIGEPMFGLNVPNAILNALLADAVAGEPAIRRIKSPVVRWTLSGDAAGAEFADGTAVTARLGVAADGRNSPTREAAGIAVRTTRHPQAALVVSFRHARPHGSVSTEFHTETGPFTVVPLPGDRSSLVWVDRPETAELLAGLKPEILSRRIEDKMQSMLGRVEVDTHPQVYPLTSGLPTAYARNRIALVGEAAHRFPPIGAQGLNLSVRDARDLAAVVAGHAADPGAPDALSAYDRKRRPDVLARSAAVRLLNRSLLSDMLPAQIARFAGLGLLGRFSPVRAFFMREGLEPGSGFEAMMSPLREKIRRKNPVRDEVEQHGDARH